jgi:hypothetical protein
MTDEQFSQLTELIKTQNDMSAHIGLILVRITWLLVTVILFQAITWIMFAWLF